MASARGVKACVAVRLAGPAFPLEAPALAQCGHRRRPEVRQVQHLSKEPWEGGANSV